MVRKIWTSAAARRLLELADSASTVDEAIGKLATTRLEGLMCPPTDLNAVAQRLGVVGICEEDIAGSGELRREATGYVIVCNPTLSPARKRFTIAHELGHALFETSGPNCPRSGKELEQLCNKFATELLMPKNVFLRELGANLSLHRLFELARMFETSLAATAIRCCELRKVLAYELAHGDIRLLGGNTQRIDSSIRTAIDSARDGKCVDTVVYLDAPALAGYWHLEGTPLGKGDRAIFLAQPLRPGMAIRS